MPSPPPAPKRPQIVSLVDLPPIAKPPIVKPPIAKPKAPRSGTVPANPALPTKPTTSTIAPSITAVSPPVMPPTRITPVIATESQQPIPQTAPAAPPNPLPNLTPSPTPNPTPSPTPAVPSTTGGAVLNQAGGQPCGPQCNDLPLAFATQDFRQQIQQTSQQPVEEIRDREEGYFMGWVVVGANGPIEYWYYRQLPGPTNRYYQFAERYETQAELSQAIAQLPAS